MNFKQYLFTESDCYKENTTLGKYINPIGIMWHSTGANNPKLSRYVGPDDGRLGKNLFNNHWNQPRERRVCPHAWIGKLKDGTIATYQSLPWTLLGWHSGSGKNGNANKLGYIGFEICEDNMKDKDYAMAVYKEAVELSAMLCKQYSLDPLGKNVIIDHQEGARLGIASNHADVRHWLGKYGITLDKMREDIKAEMQGDYCITHTVIKGDTPWALAVKYLGDGTRYPEIMALNGLAKDAPLIVGQVLKIPSKDAQPEPKPPTPEPDPTPKLVDAWARNNTLKRGSKGKVVEVLQAMLAARNYDVTIIDGDFGAQTDKAVRAYQKDMGLAVDGVVGWQSWQPLLNGR